MDLGCVDLDRREKERIRIWLIEKIRSGSVLRKLTQIRPTLTFLNLRYTSSFRIKVTTIPWFPYFIGSGKFWNKLIRKTYGSDAPPVLYLHTDLNVHPVFFSSVYNLTLYRGELAEKENLDNVKIICVGDKSRAFFQRWNKVNTMWPNHITNKTPGIKSTWYSENPLTSKS